MKLLMHMGTHKTATSYLQSVFQENASNLLQHGVLYRINPLYPAHHITAWRFLDGDYSSLADFANHARRVSAHTVLMSSEDLESCLVRSQLAIDLEKHARACGFKEIEWHVVLRDPGDYFVSLYHELARHCFVDPFTLSYGVLSKGYCWQTARAYPGKAHFPKYWYFCFDYDTFVRQLASRIGGRIVVHDFSDSSPFPGWGIFQAAGIERENIKLDGRPFRNERLTSEEAKASFIQRMKEDALPKGDSAAFMRAIERQLDSYFAALPEIQPLVREKFADGLRRLLASDFAARHPVRAL